MCIGEHLGKMVKIGMQFSFNLPWKHPHAPFQCNEMIKNLAPGPPPTRRSPTLLVIVKLLDGLIWLVFALKREWPNQLMLVPRHIHILSITLSLKFDFLILAKSYLVY